MEEKTIRLAATWIYQNRKGPDWWTPLALLPAAQPAKPIQSLGLSFQDAYRVFVALESKGLIKKNGQKQKVENLEIERYEIDWGKLPEFKKYCILNPFEKYLPGWAFNFLSRWEKVLVTCLILIITALLQSFFESIGGGLGETVNSWFKSMIGT